jgi:hypothetical protein
MRLMDSWKSLVGEPLYDVPGDGTGGGGAGAGGGEGAGGAGDSAKPGAGGAGEGAKPGETKPGPTAGNPWDTEKRGILSDLSRERTRRQELETAQTRFEADLASANKRIAALAGLAPTDKNSEAREAIRTEIAEMYPVLKGLTPEQLSKVLKVAERADSLEAAVTHHWTSHAQGMVDKAQAGIEKAVGGKLSERQLNRMIKLYHDEAASDPKFLERHEAGDVKLIDEFVQSFVEDFFEPGRRAALADITRRQRPVPDGKGRSVAIGGKTVSIKTDADFGNAMAAAFSEQGGKFGD